MFHVRGMVEVWVVPLPDAGARTRVRVGRRVLQAAHLLFLCIQAHTQ